MLEHLFNEERVAIRLGEHLPDQIARRRLTTQGLEHVTHADLGQPPQGDLVR